MSLARVAEFSGMTQDRLAELKANIEGNEPPEGMPAKEIIVFHDAGTDKALIAVFFDNEDDYRKGDEVLNAMPAGDTPGQRTSVTKYDVAVRMTV